MSRDDYEEMIERQARLGRREEMNELISRVETLETYVQSMLAVQKKPTPLSEEGVILKEVYKASCHAIKLCESKTFWSDEYQKHLTYKCYHLHDKLCLCVDDRDHVNVNFCPICGEEDNS